MQYSSVRFLSLILLLKATPSAFAQVSADPEALAKSIIQEFKPEFDALGFQTIVKFSNQTEVSRFPESPQIATFEVSSEFIDSDLNQDARTLQVCHEIGHLLGGAPLKPGDNSVIPTVSVEGQADYFATSYCLKRIWKRNIGNSPYHFHSSLCKAKYINPAEQNFCNRIAEASLSLSLFNHHQSNLKDDALHAGYLSKKDLRLYSGRPTLNNFEDRVVTETVTSWPSPQCRLDSLMAGALCEGASLQILNGIVHFKSCELSSGADSSNLSKIQSGVRPGCWLP